LRQPQLRNTSVLGYERTAEVDTPVRTVAFGLFAKSNRLYRSSREKSSYNANLSRLQRFFEIFEDRTI
jgi:hypothetical protein